MNSSMIKLLTMSQVSWMKIPLQWWVSRDVESRTGHAQDGEGSYILVSSSFLSSILRSKRSNGEIEKSLCPRLEM